MKKTSIFLCMLLLLTLAMGCSSEEENSNKQQNYLQTIAVSGCKNNIDPTNASSSNRTSVFETTEFVKYEGTEEGSLMIYHENAQFSCEAKIETNVTINENVICIIEKDVTPVTNCLCCYDLTMKIGPLENKLYKIIICKNNEQGQYVNFSIDYNTTVKGEIKVEK